MVAVTLAAGIAMFVSSVAAQEEPQHEEPQDVAKNRIELVDLISEHSTASLLVNSKNKLVQNITAFGRDSEFPYSGIAQMFLNQLDGKGLDPDRPLCVRLSDDGNMDDQIVIFCINDAAKLGAFLGLPVDHLTEGKIHKLSNSVVPLIFDYDHAMRQGDLVILGNDPKWLEAERDRDKQAEQRLTERQRAMLRSSDLAAHVNLQKTNRVLAKDQATWLERLKKSTSVDDREMVELVDDIILSSDQLVTITRYEDRLFEMSTEITFASVDALAKAIDNKVRDQNFSSTLGLPEDGLVFSTGINFEQFRSESAARVLAYAAMNSQFWLGWNMDESQISQEMMISIFGTMYRHTKATRVAFYQANLDQPLTDCSLLAVIDARDPNALLKEISELAQVALASEMTDTERTAEINRLIQQLGDQKYAVRKSASVKLALIGEPVVEPLKQAAHSDDPEIAFRAQEILASFQAARESAAKTFVNEDDLWANFRPTVKIAAEEKFAGERCLILQIETGQENAKQATLLRELFGPDWNRIRMVQVGDRFVMMLGSDVERLGIAIDQVKAGLDPIAEKAALTGRDLSHNQFQFHFSMQRIFNMMHHDRKEKQLEYRKGALSSFGFGVHEQSWLSNLFIPADDLRTIFKSF
jgi:hypothetical protein